MWLKAAKIFTTPLLQQRYLFCASPSLIHRIKQCQDLSQLTDFLQQQSLSISASTFMECATHVRSLIPRKRVESGFHGEALLKMMASVEGGKGDGKLEMMAIIRRLGSAGYSSETFFTFKAKLAESYREYLKDRQEGEDVVQWVAAYHELSLLDLVANCYRVVHLLFAMIIRQKHNLLIKEIKVLLYAMSQRSQLSAMEVILRENVLRQAMVHLEGTNVNDLLDLVGSVTHFDPTTFRQDERVLAGRIYQALSEKLEGMSQEHVGHFLRKCRRSEDAHFQSVVDRILEEVFRSVNAQGRVAGKIESVAYFLQLLLQRTAHRVFQRQELSKIEVIASKYASSCKDAEQQSSFRYFLHELIKSNCLPYDSKRRLAEILKSNKITTTPYTIYLLATHQLPITELIDTSKSSQEDIKLTAAIRLSIALSKAEYSDTATEQLQLRLKERVTAQLKSQEDLVQMVKIFKYQLEQIPLHEFHSVYGDTVGDLPSPLTPDNDKNEYRQAYLQYHMLALSSTQALQFIGKHSREISSVELQMVFKQPFYWGRESRGGQIPQNWVFVGWFELERILLGRHKSVLPILLKTLNSFSTEVALGLLSAKATATLFKMLHRMISFLTRKTTESELMADVLVRFVTRQYGNYHYESNYRSLVRHMLQRVHLLGRNTQAQKRILEAGMRLNLVTAEHLQKLEWSKTNLSIQVKDRLRYIADNSFKPEYKRVEMKHLAVILSNPNCLDVVYQKRPFIINMVQKMGGVQVGQLLGCFEYDQPQTLPILEAIVERVCDSIEQVVMADLQSILRNIMNKRLHSLTHKFRGLALALMEAMVKVGVDRFSLQTHFDAISFLTTQQSLPSGSYYSKLVRNYQGNQQNYASLLSKLVSSNYTLKAEDVPTIQFLAGRKPSQALKILLMAQGVISKEKTTELAKKVVSGLMAGNEKSPEKVYRQFIDYFKTIYPEETAELSLPEQQIVPLTFTRPLAASHKNILYKIVASTGGSLSERELSGGNVVYTGGELTFVPISSTITSATNMQDFIRRWVEGCLEGQAVVLPVGEKATTMLDRIERECYGMVEISIIEAIRVEFKKKL